MEKKTIELNVEATQATKALDKFGGTLEDVYGEGVQPLNFAIGELEDRLYELAAAGNKGSKEFKDIAAEVGRMKKVIIETDMEVDGLSMTMGQKLGGSLGGLAGGFELVQGTMGAMGVESAKVEEALLKVNSAMAIAQGVQSVKEAIPAFKALNAVILANPIAAIVTAFMALGTVAMAWASTVSTKVVDGFKNMSKSVTKYREDLEKANEAQNKSTDKVLKSLDQEAARRKAMGEDAIKVQKEINEQKIKELEIAIQQDRAAIRSLNAQKEKLKLLKQESKEQLLQQIQAEQIALAGSIHEAQRAVYLKRITNLTEQAKEIDKESNTQISAINEQLKTRTAELETQKDTIEALKTEQVQLNREQGEKAAEAIKKANEAKAEKDFEKQKEQDLLEVQQMQLKTRSLATIEIDTEKAKNEILAGLDAEEKAAAEQREKEHQEALKVMRERNAKFAVDTSIEAFSTIQALADAFAGKSEASQKKAFKIRKAAAIAQTVIETYKAAQGAYASQIIPGDPTSPIRGAIAATIAVASGLAKVKSISAQKFEGGGSSGGSGGGSAPSLPSSTPANFNIVGNSNTNQIVEGLNANPVQAFVVSGEVTSAQSLDRNRIKTATL